VLVTVTVTDPPGTPDDGDTAHEAMLDAALLQPTVTFPVNPPSPLIPTVNGEVDPLFTLAVAGTVRLKSHTVPDTAIACGLPLALSVSVMLPLDGPGAAPVGGANVTLIVQVPAGAIDPAVQLSVSVKFADVDWICVIVRAELPLLVIVTG
jgi:hypothetical protein